MENNLIKIGTINLDIKFPNVFHTGILDTQDNATACAYGLQGWACCFISMPPEKFGEGMVAIGDLLGIIPLKENLMEYANSLKTV